MAPRPSPLCLRSCVPGAAAAVPFFCLPSICVSQPSPPLPGCSGVSLARFYPTRGSRRFLCPHSRTNLVLRHFRQPLLRGVRYTVDESNGGSKGGRRWERRSRLTSAERSAGEPRRLASGSCGKGFRGAVGTCMASCLRGGDAFRATQ